MLSGNEHATLVSVFVVLALAWPSAGALRNYENDPELAKALEYDSEYNGGKRLEKAQALAERHYLAYLERTKDPVQRARVCVQLGVLFGTNYHPELGEKPDYAKSRAYMQKALAENPNGVDLEMVRARLFMATPLQTPEERLRIRIEVYKWLNSIDEEKAEKDWAPDYPGQDRKAGVAVFLKVLANVREAEATNIPWEASLSSDPLANLNLIKQQLPGTQAAAKAEARLERWVNELTEPVIDASLHSFGISTTALSDDGLGGLGASAAAAKDGTVAGQAMAEGPAGRMRPICLAVAAVALVALAAFIAIVVSRRRRSSA